MINTDTPVKQNPGTKQCWWLSCLEILRLNGTLPPLFEEGQRLDLDVPEEDGDQVYGDDWQRVVMQYLKDNGWTHGPQDGIMTVALRKAELKTLQRKLGNDSPQDPVVYNLTASSVKDRVNGLDVGSYVQVDKRSHAMVGTVMASATALGNQRISVYNQSDETTRMFEIVGSGSNKKLKCRADNTELDMILVL